MAFKTKKRYSIPRRTAAVDTECFQNYWSFGLKDVASRRSIIIEKYEGKPLDIEKLRELLQKWRIVTFNGEKYDLPMICLAMSGASNADLKRASDELIVRESPLFKKHWLFYERYDVGRPVYIDMIDWFSVSPGSPQMPSLKQYAGRLHLDRMQDLPLTPDAWVTPEDRRELRKYLGHDLDDTIGGYLELKPQIDLRAEISDEYGVDVRSKSDAQTAEAILKATVQARTGRYIPKPTIDYKPFKFDPPAFISFKTPVLQELFEKVCNTEFKIDYDGNVILPSWMEKGGGDEGVEGVFTIGLSSYKLGIGGLHSQEKSRSWIADDEYELLDEDVTSYYPKTIIETGLYPEAIGPVFISIFKEIFDRRVHHKAQSQSKDIPDSEIRYHANIAETLKIVLNGLFGKFGSQYACVYAPKLLIQTTMTGQLSILMAIEAAELNGFSVVSANTDGFVTRVDRARRSLFDAILLDWQMETGYNLEATNIKSLHSRDVNNYFAITLEKDGKMKIKAKGAFGPSGPGQKGAAGMKKNVDCTISNDAVIEYLKHGKPIEETIRSCRDIRLFITQRKVAGGAEKDGVFIGKQIRVYYATGVEGFFTIASGKQEGNKVPMTDGAKEIMQLPDELDDFPSDVDFDWYIRESYAILGDIGMPSIDPALRGRTGHMPARFDDQKTVHMVSLPTGIAACGKTRKTIRESLIEEPNAANEGLRMCKKCQSVISISEL